MADLCSGGDEVGVVADLLQVHHDVEQGDGPAVMLIQLLEVLGSHPMVVLLYNEREKEREREEREGGERRRQREGGRKRGRETNSTPTFSMPHMACLLSPRSTYIGRSSIESGDSDLVSRSASSSSCCSEVESSATTPGWAMTTFPWTEPSLSASY